MKKQNHTSHFAPHTSQKGITLIALIITIIVMLILVGVTINVAINGGLFERAKTAGSQMQIEADKEELLSAVVAAIGTDGKVVLEDIELPTEDWSGTSGTYTSPSGNTFTVDANGKITHIGSGEMGEEGNEIVTANLEYMRNELVGKTFLELVDMDVSTDSNIILKNTAITVIGYTYSGKPIVSYNGEEFIISIEGDGELEYTSVISSVNYYVIVADSNDYFNIETDGTNVMILGLTVNGSSELAVSKKLVIPKIILGTDGKEYNVTKIESRAFNDNVYLEVLEFDNNIKLETIEESTFSGCDNLSTVSFPKSLKTIGEWAFAHCDNLSEIEFNEGLITIELYAFQHTKKLTSVTLPQSITNIGVYAFYTVDSELTISLAGRTEEPATTDSYSGTGFERNWCYSRNTKIICLGE